MLFIMAAPGKNINGPRESMFARVVSHPQGNEVKIPLTGERKLSKETLCSQFPGAIGLKYMHGEHWSAVPILNEYFVLPEDDVQFVVVLNTAGARQILSGSLAGYSSFSFANRVANVMNKEAKSFAPKSNVPYGNRGMLRKQVKQKTPKPFSKTYKDIAEDINSCSNDGTMPTEIFDQQEPSCSSIGKQSSSSLTPAVSLEPAATASTSSDISTSALPFSNVTCPMSPSKETELEDFELVKPKRKRPLRRAAWRFQQTLSSAHSQQQTGLTRQVREENPDTNIIEVMDSEDEELQQVLEESLLSSNDKIPSSVVNIVTLLKTYQGKINKFDKQEIVVFRKRVLDSAFRALKRHSFDVKCKLYVKFSGEIGLDHGGPRREFFRLILLELSLKPSLLTGPDNNKIFTHNLYGLEQNQFGMLGKLVAMSLAQEGPGMGFLNPEVFMLMTGLDPKLQEFDLSLITDIDARSILEELRNLDTVNKVESFLAKHGDWIVDQGVHNVWHLKINDIPMTLHATASEINQFCKGMEDVCGLMTEIKKHPDAWQALFCENGHQLSKDNFLNECDVIYSAKGSNKREGEEETIYSFELFLQEIEDKTVPFNFGELLAFITGADKIPPCGFENKIQILFFDQEEGTVRLPFVSTCALNISLPRNADPDKIKELLTRALTESLGFGKC